MIVAVELAKFKELLISPLETGRIYNTKGEFSFKIASVIVSSRLIFAIA
ncbi:hypothetical protein [Lyngbya sp. PCC 8106]